jgi:sulfatase maturation enzyme AslB (radical SAM superfamily)
MPKYLSFAEFEQSTKDFPRISYLETMLTYACTLSCKSCTNYSDYGMKGGYVKWTEIKPVLDQWFDRIRVDCFGFIGGEPLMNPELETWVREFRTEYPYTTVMIGTNAQLFTKNLWLLDAMEELGMIYLKFTNHIPNAEYFKQAVDAVMSRFDWQWMPEWNRYFYQEKILDFLVSESPTFMKTYQGKYGSMKPHNNNPTEAFEICSQQICPLLYNGKLYKCSSLGMLKRVLGDHNQIDDPDWAPYVINQGLGIDCTDKELQAWADNFGLPIKECSMCPTTRDNPFHPHYPNVVNRINIY